MADEKKAPELSKALQDKYKLKHVTPGPFMFKHVKYDTTTMDELTAEKLVAEKCPYIEKVTKQPTSAFSSRG